MFNCNDCMRNYPTLESLKRHVRYAHTDNRVKCRWCPYDVSSDATYRMKQHEKTRHWYKFKDGNKQTEKQNKKTPTRKVSSVVEKKKKSTDNEKTKLPSAECSPLREPSPMTVEFEDLMATKLTTPTEDLSFTLPVIAVTDIEQSLDSTPLMSVQEVNEPIKEDDNKEKPVQVNKKPDDQEPEEQPKENTFTEVREELVEVSEDGVKVMNEDIGLVEINCMTRTPTPSYLPSRITPTNLKYGRVYDYRHYGLPEDKDKEDPRQVLLCPPSTYHSSKEAILLRRLREQARRSHIDTTTLPDGYSGLVKTERCELPDGTVYSLTSHWVSEIPVRRYRTSGSQVSTTLETRDKDVQIVPTTTDSGTQTEKIKEIQFKTHEDKEVNCDIIACRIY